MIRAAIFLSLFGAFLVGCDQLDFEETPQEQLDAVMRLAKAPEATDEFMNKFSTIECKAKIKNLCTPRGCEKGPVSVTQRYDVQKQTYQRTDGKGGDEYPVEASHSGVWFNFSFPRNAMLFRVNTLGDFTEVVTENDLTIVYAGSCQFR